MNMHACIFKLSHFSVLKVLTQSTACSNDVSDALWQMNLRSREAMESGHYPVREGEPDCSYYIRTGLCRFGATCRFNHPTNRKLVNPAAGWKVNLNSEFITI